jgi:hypothetical protein
MLNGRYDSYYIIRECKTHLNVDLLRDDKVFKKIKRCTYKWKIYADTGGMADDFTVRTEKQVGQPLVFKREDFLTNYEISDLYPSKLPEPEQQGIDFPKSDETPF